jgi:hypothetical protein
VSAAQHSTQRRWLLIQVHRARIALLLRSGQRDRGSQIAERMNAIALLCDRGRTELGRALAERLVRLERDAAEPIVTELLVGEPVELAGRASSGDERR